MTSPFFSIGNLKEIIFPFTSYVIGFLLWIVLLKMFKVSYIYPLIIALSSVTVVVLSRYVLNEDISVNRLFGILLMIVAVFLLSVE